MDRAEAIGTGVSAVGIIGLMTVLSLHHYERSTPKLPSPVEVQLVNEVGLKSAMLVPQPKPPAQSAATEVAPKIPPTAQPIVSPHEIVEQETPTSSVVKSNVTPAHTRAKSAEAKMAPTANPEALSKSLGLSAPAAHAKPQKNTGLAMALALTEGDAAQPSKGLAKTPHAVTIDKQAMAGLSDAIRRQVQPCADRALNPGPGAEAIVIKLNLHLNVDGSFATAPVVVGQPTTNDDNRRYAQRVKELAIGAYTQCAPYHLPPEFYEQGWKNINARFNTKP